MSTDGGGDALVELIRQLGAIGTAVATGLTVRWAARNGRPRQEQEADDEPDE